MSKLINVLPVIVSYFMWTDRQTDVVKLIVAFRNFANAPNKALRSWFQTFSLLWMLYSFFWLISLLLNFTCLLFGTLCLFHLHVNMEQTDYWETSARKIQKPRYHPKERSVTSSVYWAVRHCDSWGIKDQLDVTCYFISLLMCSTCFGH